MSRVYVEEPRAVSQLSDTTQAPFPTTTTNGVQKDDEPQKRLSNVKRTTNSRWAASVVRGKPPRKRLNRILPRPHQLHPKSSQILQHHQLEEEQEGHHQQQQQGLGVALKCVQKPRICNVIFPASSLFPEKKKVSLFDDGTATPVFSTAGESDNIDGDNAYVIEGIVPQDALPQPFFTVARDKWLFRQSGRHKPRPEALVVHPQGFRILKDRSSVERSLHSYFRLPPAPSARLNEERRQAQKMLMAVDATEDEEEQRFFGPNREGLLPQLRTLLDGFMLLCAGGQSEPEAVERVTLQCSHLIGVIDDDMIHFQNLRFLDLSENELLLEHLLSLSGLEVLHLAYNKINSLAGILRTVKERQLQLADANLCGPHRGSTSGAIQSAMHDTTSIRSAAAYYAQGKKSPICLTNDDVQRQAVMGASTHSSCSEFVTDKAGYYSPHQKTVPRPHQNSECSMHDVLLPKLHALNLSFNNIPSGDILHLSYFPFLEKLDLSGNNLRTLPEDLADLTSVTHLALERNSFRDGNAIFASLSTMPALIEVNLNHNELRHVPPLSVKNGRGLCFPSIEVMGLGHNEFKSVRDVAALSELVRTLQRIVLAGNPIASRRKERSAAQTHFAQAVMNLYWEQAGIRGNVDGGSGHLSHFCSDLFHEDLPLSHAHQNYATEYDDDEDTSEKNYHGWGSLVDSWQRQRHPVMSKSSTNPTGGQNNNHDDDDTFLEHINLAAVNTSAIPSLESDDATINDVFWYDDAEQSPSYNTAAATFTHTLKELPTPSVLRFVELVFDDVVMQKQKPSYFYAKRRQLAVEDTTLPLSLVDPKTGLVTVPKYSEFMDIYHIMEDPPLSRRTFKKRQYATERERRRGRFSNFIIPQVHSDVEREEEDTKEEKEPVVAASAEVLGVNAHDDDDDESGGSFCGSVSSRDVVFMTGVAFQERRGRHSKKQGKGQGQADEEKDDDCFSEITDVQVLQSDTDTQTKSEEVSRQRSKANQNKRVFQGTFLRGKKERDLSSTLAEPPSTNVRILMNELRRMLRRPLPPLPPVSKRKATGRNVGVL